MAGRNLCTTTKYRSVFPWKSYKYNAEEQSAKKERNIYYGLYVHATAMAIMTPTAVLEKIFIFYFRNLQFTRFIHCFRRYRLGLAEYAKNLFSSR